MRFRLCPVVAAIAAGVSLAQPEAGIRLIPVTAGVRNPTDIQSPRDGSGRLFLVEQQGRILVFGNGALESEPFLDIRDRTIGQGESGLLGLAFPPDFARRRAFYVNYTDLGGDTVVARYRLSESTGRGDRSSEVILLTVRQPYDNHNGGGLQFGVRDGMLYIGMGDGGSGGDPHNHAQRPDSLLGKMLRLDVESDPGRYRVPAGNPFVNDHAWRLEVWAYGLRNPWRFAFDRLTADLWIADVGQEDFEEVSFQPAASGGGENYGWSLMEGGSCFKPDCDATGLRLPVADYDHLQGCSVTGGYVYRGARSPGLRGTYLYGDLCSGAIWGIRREGSGFVTRRLASSGINMSTFGEDEDGEIYVADHATGRIFRIAGAVEPTFTAAGVVNAAGGQPGLVAGSLATVFVYGIRDTLGETVAGAVPLPDSLGGVRVLVNGRSAAILSAGNPDGQEQVRFQVPWEVAGDGDVSLVVSKDGVRSRPVLAPLLATQPAIFARDGAMAVAVHGSVNVPVTPGSPAEPGEWIYFYATGLGAVDRAPLSGHAPAGDGFSRTLETPRVTVAGAPCEVQFAGLAPGLVGVYQVNMRVPDRLSSGTHELSLGIGGAESPPVKLPVR